MAAIAHRLRAMHVCAGLCLVCFFSYLFFAYGNFSTYVSGGGTYLVGVEMNPGPRKKASGKGKGKESNSNSGSKKSEKSLADSLAKVKAHNDKLKQDLKDQAEKFAEPANEMKKLLDQMALDNLQAQQSVDPTTTPIVGVPVVKTKAAHDDARVGLFERLIGDFKNLTLTPGNPYLVLDHLPAEQWEKYIRSDREKNLREGLLVEIFDLFGAWNQFENVRKIELRAFPYAVQPTEGAVPWRDAEADAHDCEITYFQPAIVITYHDGSERLKFVETVARKWTFVDEVFNLIDQPLTQRSLETLSEGRYFNRCGLEIAPGIKTCIMQPLCVSSYLFNQLYSRRTILTPKMSESTTVERLLRFAAEDNQVSAQLNVQLIYHRNVLKDTVSFLTGVVVRNMTTPMPDF